MKKVILQQGQELPKNFTRMHVHYVINYMQESAARPYWLEANALTLFLH